MMTIIEKDGWVRWCGKEEVTGEMPTKDFFTGSFLATINDTTVFVYDFQDIAMFFIKALLEAGYADATETELSYAGNHKLDRGTFKYVLSDTNNAFYSVSYRVNDKVVNLYEFKNLVSSDIKDVVRDFEGSECVAMYRACIEMRSYAPKSTTASSCGYSYWKKKYTRKQFEALFVECSEKAEKICRNAYHGGLCYMSDKCNTTMTGKGIVLDANSLYSFVMKNSYFAMGKENYGEGEIPKGISEGKNPYYIHFRARFNLKKDHVPFLRTRCDKRHWQMEILESSDYIDSYGNHYQAYNAPGEEWVDEWGEIHFDQKPFMVELCLYRDEYELMFEQYDVYDIEYIDHVWWRGYDNVFTEYVDEFYEMKKNAGNRKARRRIAKIIQNALSGRMSLKKVRESAFLKGDIIDEMNKYNSFDYINRRRSQHGKYTDEECLESGVMSLKNGCIKTTSKSMSHIQIGAAITSIAMCYIVRKAQANYDRFLYTDTDSLHLLGTLEDVKDVEISEELGQFKIEHRFVYAKYYKQKVYTLMEVDERGNDLGACVTWAGMPEDCQKILEAFLTEEYIYTTYTRDIADEVSQVLRKKARPEGISDYDWDHCIGGWITKEAKDNLHKLELPHVRKVVKSYKDYSFEYKTEWYRVEVMDRIHLTQG